MELDQRRRRRSFSLVLLLLLIMSHLSSSSSSSSSQEATTLLLSDAIFDASASASVSASARSLLQARKGCPVNFEFMNYTVITSECKGPRYPPDRCCSSFKVFACPYADMLNDVTNDCAITMFSYINLYGHYPPGLFASQCREGKLGLECPADSPSAASTANAAPTTIPYPSSLPFLLFAACLVFLLHF